MTAAAQELESLRERLMAIFARGWQQPVSDHEFARTALDVFRVQYELNPVYRAYCDRRGRTPKHVEQPTDIPAVPTVAFKELRLMTAPAGEDRVDAVFRTSGTTRGRERRGEHVVPDLSLYRASLLPALARYVLPDRGRMDLLSLVPAADERPDSSLSYMVQVAIEELGSEQSGWFVSEDGGLDAARLIRALRNAESSNRPVALLGTTLAFDHLLEHLEDDGPALRMPVGSRIMDTGGSKGARREVSAERMAERYTSMLGIPRAWQVNEYGMTELCSQFYDGRVRAAAAGRTPAPSDERKAPPPWMRSTAVDPVTLEPMALGETGILRHHDLANLGSVAAVQTEDLGRVHEDGTVELMGRLPGAQPRGCSIALDLMLEDRHG